MIVNSSAIVAVLLNEPEREILLDALDGAERCMMSSVSYLESCIVVAARRGPMWFSDLDALVEAAGIQIVSFTAEQARIARSAYAQYGKGVHRAGLNFGDCAAYALAVAESEPLLYKGDDFRQTDVESAL